MKAEELMIGDLLTFKDCVGDSGFPILKVNGILPDTLFVQIDYSDADDEVDYEDIIGIPLTPEILEKNFKEFIPGINLMYGLGGPYVASDEEGQWVFGLVREEPPARYPLVRITYVHELQHALRLCGIEKEITI